jgi:CHASE3 domain sensor protein
MKSKQAILLGILLFALVSGMFLWSRARASHAVAQEAAARAALMQQTQEMQRRLQEAPK